MLRGKQGFSVRVVPRASAPLPRRSTSVALQRGVPCVKGGGGPCCPPAGPGRPRSTGVCSPCGPGTALRPLGGGGPALTTIPPDPPRGAISGASGVLNPGSWGEQRSTKASWLCPQRPNPDPIGPRVWAARERVTEVTETPATWFLRVSRRDRLWSPRPPSALQQRRHTYFKLKKKKHAQAAKCKHAIQTPCLPSVSISVSVRALGRISF